MLKSKVRAKQNTFIISFLTRLTFLLGPVYDLFPIAIGVTTVLVFILVGFSFGSLLIPLRAIYSIGLTLAFVYGTAVWVYQDGALNFLHFSGLHDNTALSWFSPILSFSVVVGLGLDYDVFLLSRIQEFRKVRER